MLTAHDVSPVKRHNDIRFRRDERKDKTAVKQFASFSVITPILVNAALPSGGSFLSSVPSEKPRRKVLANSGERMPRVCR